MILFKLILFTLFISRSYCRHPDKVYCVDKGCEGPISKAKTLLSYTSVDPDLISFRGNSDALVYMKSAGTNSDLWFVNINGKSGFANSRFLREYKILEKNPQVIVPYEPKAQENVVQPDKVQQAHEVFEGTTIYTTEAAVNNAQQDSTTESPVTSSNDDLTPSLDSVGDTKKESVNESFQDVPSQESDEAQDESQNAEAQADSNLDIKITTELPEQAEASINENQNIDSSADAATDSTEKVATNNLEDHEHQISHELPEEMPTETSAQHLLSSNSGTLNSEALLEVPENKKFNSLTESEQTDSKELNVSTPNNNVENMQLDQEASVESNLPNGDSSNPLNSPFADQPQQHIPPVFAGTVDTVNQGDNDAKDTVTNVNDVQRNEDNAVTEPWPIDSAEKLHTIEPIQALPELAPELEIEAPNPPPSEVVPSDPSSSETVAAVPSPPETVTALPPTSEVLSSHPLTTETVPTVPLPSSETVPALPPVATETIPAFFPQGAETIPAVTNEKILVPDNQYNHQESSYSEDFITTPAPFHAVDETMEQDMYTSSTPAPDSYSADVMEENTYTTKDEQSQEEFSTTTEATVQDEHTEGFFANMYSTVADMLPSSTETPPPIYNTEDYPTYENENSDKAKVNEGFSFMKYMMSTYFSIMGTSEESKALFASVGETCYTDEYCDGTSNDGSNRLLTFLLTTASSVLLFTLGYYYIDNRRQDGRLIGQINSLQRDLLFTTKECEILKEELSSTKNKLAGIEDSSFGMDDMVQSLKEEINELKATNDRLRNSLDDNEKLLRVSENTAGELQNTLSEVENTLSELLTERANSEEQIVELNGKIQAFEEELIAVSRDRDNFQLKYVSAETALEEFKKQKRQLEDLNLQLTEAKNTIELQKHEIDALKDAIRELKSGMPSNVDVTSLIDHTEIKAKLSKALQERKKFETKYEAEHEERSRLAEELQATQETLHTTSQNANEALTRLDVLGKYFQERESELMKELSAKESLWLSKQGESASTVEKIEVLQQEVQRYKEKCDALTLELAEQESSRRTALSAVEARAHAAWLEARAARRDADAARDEAAALRRKLAAMSTMSAADGAVSPHHKVASPLENVDNPVIPPPLPPMFLPPPLLPPLPRPPPLGRLPSPHPPRYGDRRYTSDSRYSPESRYSPDSRYSPETVRYSPDSRYSPPRTRRSPYSPRSRRRSRSRERYDPVPVRGSRSRNGPAPPDTETEYNSDSPSREPRRRRRYSRHSGPSSGSGCSSESDK